MVGRFSLVKAEGDRKDEVVQLYQQLDEIHRTADGYVASCIFVNPSDPREVGRLALWRSHADADRAATPVHVVALRSQIHEAIQPGHTEKIVDVVSSVNL